MQVVVSGTKKNNGTTFSPILDNSPTQNVGSLAVDWKSGTIWVGDRRG
jgi:hypothetical protein